jgi:hypothetical protein
VKMVFSSAVRLFASLLICSQHRSDTSCARLSQMLYLASSYEVRGLAGLLLGLAAASTCAASHPSLLLSAPAVDTHTHTHTHTRTHTHTHTHTHTPNYTHTNHTHTDYTHMNCIHTNYTHTNNTHTNYTHANYTHTPIRCPCSTPSWPAPSGSACLVWRPRADPLQMRSMLLSALALRSMWSWQPSSRPTGEHTDTMLTRY